MLNQRRKGDRWVGVLPASPFGPVAFGGVGLAITIMAASREAPPPSRLHSLHAHFLRSIRVAAEVEFETQVVKAGRSFWECQVRAIQDEKAAIAMTCSFTVDSSGYEYDLAGLPDGVPQPEDLAEPDVSSDVVEPWDVRWLEPSPLRSDGTREATHRHWFRFARQLGDDPRVHAALLGYTTDWTGVGGRPLHLEGDTTGMISLDHAAWFHRPVRADQWLLQDVQSLVNAGGRGTLRGVIRDRNGRIMVSMAQEMLIQPVTDVTSIPG